MSAAPVPAAACHNHPGRDALGVCVQCRQRVCAECVTKVDGINYCVACYQGLAAPPRREAASTEVSGTSAALWAGGLFVVLTLLLWGFFEVALPTTGG
ncbi:MAG: B-box zinc finger protein [Sandaracinaceae bacterium]